LIDFVLNKIYETLAIHCRLDCVEERVDMYTLFIRAWHSNR
jgi:hypothetical protein